MSVQAAVFVHRQSRPRHGHVPCPATGRICGSARRSL